MKTAIQFIKICMNLFKDITSLDLSEPLMATLEIIEKAVSSIKKSNEINVENKEFEELVNDILEVLVMFRDQMVKRRTILNQEQWIKKPIVNLITDTITEVCVYCIQCGFTNFPYTMKMINNIIIKQY